MKQKLSTLMAEIDNKFYRVNTLPDSLDPADYDRGVAYIYKTDLTNSLLPYRGEIDRGEEFDYNSAKPGIYLKRIKGDNYKRIIIIPKGQKEREEYSIDRVKDIVAAMLDYEYVENQFMDNDLKMSDIGRELYQPPIYAGDDPINMITKLCIRLKNAPFEPYGKRLESLAIDRKNPNEKNNTPAK